MRSIVFHTKHSNPISAVLNGTLVIATSSNSRHYRGHSSYDALTFPALELQRRELAWVLRATKNPTKLGGAASLFIPGLDMNLYGSMGVAYIAKLDNVIGTEENNCSHTTGWSRGSEEGASISEWDLEESNQPTYAGSELAERMVNKYNRTGKTISHNETTTPGDQPVAVFTSSYNNQSLQFLEAVRKETGNRYIPMVYLVSTQGESGKQYPNICVEQRKLPYVDWAAGITHARENGKKNTVLSRDFDY